MNELKLKDNSKRIKWITHKHGFDYCESRMYVDRGVWRMDVKDEDGEWREAENG